MDKFIGIDISKQTFDVSFSPAEHDVYSNDTKGFAKLLRKIDTSYGVLMEASGPYYVKLANFFHEKGYKVYVENPLKVKRYAQSRLFRAKTDKKDAEIIRCYAETMSKDLRLWKPDSQAIIDLKQLYSYKEMLLKQQNQLGNQLKAFEATGHIDKKLKSGMSSMLRKIEKELVKTEAKLIEICQKEYKETLELLLSIPSISYKSAVILIAVTDGFTKFENYKQVIAYLGMSPRIFTSGTSVKGAEHICKVGNAQVRKILYMCSLTAGIYNKGCRELNERLMDKGKPMKVRRIAIANKLIKQAFAVVKSGKKYDENYEPKICF